MLPILFIALTRLKLYVMPNTGFIILFAKYIQQTLVQIMAWYRYKSRCTTNIVYDLMKCVNLMYSFANALC